jgi:hypothetical protein
LHGTPTARFSEPGLNAAPCGRRERHFIGKSRLAVNSPKDDAAVTAKWFDKMQGSFKLEM